MPQLPQTPQPGVAAEAEQTTAAIGRLSDTVVVKNWPGQEVLDLPDWTIAKNDQSVHVGSNPAWGNVWDVAAGRTTVFGREAVASGTNALKGVIAGAIPSNLAQQLALGAAREGQGSVIMRGLADAPRLVANYGEGEWVKMQYVLRGTDSNVTVHYFRNLTTKMDVEFKFT